MGERVGPHGTGLLALQGIIANARGRVVLETSNLVGKDDHYRGDKLIRHWVTHLASHLAGGPLTTMVVSLKGQVELKPVEIGVAQAHLKTLLAAWQRGMRSPLPLAARTAFVWLRVLLQVVDDDEGPDAAPPELMPELTLQKARNAARKAYEGAYKQQGEVQTCAYLQRAYPDFDTLYANGEFAELAESLLRPLQRAMPVERKKTNKPVVQPDVKSKTGAAA